MKMGAMALYAIGIVLGLAALVLSFTGIPGGFDTEPILGAGLIVLALAGMISFKD
ncbi:MAG: hypothetical protein ACFE7I_06970 [Candidatus Hodarchaeota archaeon]